MEFLLNIFAFAWLIRTIKFVLFWIYLWQLKEYHIGRFKDHFRTEQGKKLWSDRLLFAKAALAIILLADVAVAFAGSILLIIYFAEAMKFAISAIRGKTKLPKPTLKALLLTTIAIMATVLFVLLARTWAYAPADFLAALLLFDILLPVIVSAFVLAFQPIFVALRAAILQKARNIMRQRKDLIVVGITGSYGKTSTKEFLTAILSAKFNVLSTPAHKNSEIGIAQTVINDLRGEHKIFIVEMGSYNKGGIDLLCGIVKPSIGMVTGVNQQHLATFGSMENLLSAEGGRELLQNLPKDGLLAVNGDNAHCMDLYKRATVNKKAYALGKDKIDADIWAQEISVHADSVDFVAITREGAMAHMKVRVLGRQHVQNLLGAIMVAKELGMSLEEISRAVQRISPEQGGMTRKKGIHGIEVIDSSYSANPDGVLADLDFLSIFPGKKVIVMPSLIELGEASQKAHQSIGKKIAKTCDMAIITTKDEFDVLRQAAVHEGMAEDKIIFSPEARNILARITFFCTSGDTVLLEGRVPSELLSMLNKKG